VRLPHRQHAHLHRREPERQVAAVVLEQDPDEALERAEQRAVDDVRHVLAVVGAHVRAAEPLRLLAVELDRPICHGRPSASSMKKSIFGP
jgi:hypothetical protein